MVTIHQAVDAFDWEMPGTEPDGTTDKTTSYLTRLSNNDSQVIGYSHSTKRANDARQVAGYGESDPQAQPVPDYEFDQRVAW